MTVVSEIFVRQRPEGFAMHADDRAASKPMDPEIPLVGIALLGAIAVAKQETFEGSQV